MTQWYCYPHGDRACCISISFTTDRDYIFPVCHLRFGKGNIIHISLLSMVRVRIRIAGTAGLEKIFLHMTYGKGEQFFLPKKHTGYRVFLKNIAG